MSFIGNYFKNMLWNLVPVVGPLIGSFKTAYDINSFLKGVVTSGTNTSTPSEGLSSLLRNVSGSYLGTGLTDAQKEANDFTHNERIDAQNWTAQREDTMYQRQVGDMRAAGLNPMLAAGGTPVNASSSSGNSSVSPSVNSLSGLLELFKLPSEIDKNKAAAEASRAQANKNNEQAGTYATQIEEAKARIAKLLEETKNESEKRELIMAQTALTKLQALNVEAQTSTIEALRDSQVKLNKANAENADAQAKKAAAEAGLAFVNKLYQQKLIDNGMAEAVVNKIKAEEKLADAQTRDAVARALINRLEAGRTSGSFIDVLQDVQRELGRDVDASTKQNIADVIVGIASNFTNLFKGIL